MLQWLSDNKAWLFDGMGVALLGWAGFWLFSKAQNSKHTQKQKSGAHSTNIQADHITISGVTYTEAKEIALDVFRANFITLKGDAVKIAQNRAEEITEKFLSDLRDKNPTGMRQSQDPDFQNSLFTVQKEYARTGDKQLGNLLVNLLIDRTKTDTRSLQQIVLNEAIHTAPKLTNDQLATLSIDFLLRNTKSNLVVDMPTLVTYLNGFIKPFVEELSKKEMCYRHLEYTGCGSVTVLEIGAMLFLVEILQDSPRFFSSRMPYMRRSQATSTRETLSIFVGLTPESLCNRSPTIS